MNRRCFMLAGIAAAFCFLIASSVAFAASATDPGPAPESWPMLASIFALLLPIGLALIGAAGLPEDEARQAALTVVGALGIATLAYFGAGFALQFGGLGLVNPHVDYATLIWEWTPLDVNWGTGWGVIGLKGFALSGDVATPAVMTLFLAQLPWVITATLLPLLALRGRFHPIVLLLCALLVSGFLYPVVGNWVWGGGWLANLGRNIGSGHGLVDFAGAGSIHLLGAAVALAGILMLPRRPKRNRREPTPLPPAHLPLLAVLGAGLVTVALPALAWANPLPDWNTLSMARIGIAAVLSACGGALAPLAYTWFSTGRTDALMTARGVAAGAVASAASLPFVPPLYMLAIGTAAGVLTLIAVYLIDNVIRLDDRTAVLSMHGLAAAWGLLAVGLFADGKAGQGYNQIGIGAYLGVDNQGVTGLLPAVGIQPDWPGQFQAQGVSLLAILLGSFLLGTLLLAPFAAASYAARRLKASAKASLPSPAPEPVSETALTEEEALAPF